MRLSKQELELLIDNDIKDLENLAKNKIEKRIIDHQLIRLSKHILRYSTEHYDRGKLWEYRNRLYALMGIDTEEKNRFAGY